MTSIGCLPGISHFVEQAEVSKIIDNVLRIVLADVRKNAGHDLVRLPVGFPHLLVHRQLEGFNGEAGRNRRRSRPRGRLGLDFGRPDGVRGEGDRREEGDPAEGGAFHPLTRCLK
jgi:hypothetical protein